MKNLFRKLRDKSDDHKAGTTSSAPSTSSHTSSQAPALAAVPTKDVSPAIKDLAKRTFKYFYSPTDNQFQAKTKSDSTLGENDHFGYVVWPVIIMVQATAECLSKSNPEIIQKSLSALQAYWNPEKHGFCAWKMFPGNTDIYYDDNCHAAQALITAYEETSEIKHLRQAQDILETLIMPSAQEDGGVPWHTNNPNCRNACSTGPAAVAALRIYLCHRDTQKDDRLLVFAKRALNWLIENLQDPDDHLIWDSLQLEEENGTNKNVNKTKWTYNTGFAIHGFSLLHEVTKDDDHLTKAVELAEAALNQESPLFDHALPLGQRMYSDSSFFLHHLVDGYLALQRSLAHRTSLTGQPAIKLKERWDLGTEIDRIANWGKTWMLDPTDGLYFRGSSPYTISLELAKKYNEQFGVEKDFQANGQERDEQGELCKTLIGNAGWIRILRMADNSLLEYSPQVV